MVDVHLSVLSLNFNQGRQQILHDINCELKSPQVVCLLGPNGAGKSTLLKCLAGQRHPSSGQILLNELDAHQHRSQYLSKVGYMPEQAMTLAELTVMEQLQLMAEAKGLSNDSSAIERVVEHCKLNAVLCNKVAQLSLGFRQRLNLAQALMAQPSVLIMDEPLNGLDPHSIIELRHTIQSLKTHTLIIFSTHYLAEAHTVSDRVLIMQSGQIKDNIDVSSLHDGQDLERLYLSHTQHTGALHEPA